jgi:DUF4097 and DUF4098 domain-containing protein YvlB
MDYVRTLSRALETGDRVELTVENRSGTVVVRGEHNTTRVTIDVTAQLWAEDDREADDQVELIARGIRQEGKRLLVRAPALLRPRPFLFFGRAPKIDYHITVPAQSRVEIDCRSGRVDVSEVRGPVNVTCRSGRTLLRDIGGDVDVTSWSGGLQAERIAGTIRIDSRSGSVRIDGCAGDCTVASRSGSHAIDGVRGSLQATTRSGTAAITNVEGALTFRARSGSVRYEGAVNRDFEIDVMSGSVRLAVDPSSAFFLDAESATGSVRSDLPVRNRDNTTPGGAPMVRIRTMAGSISIGLR